MFTVNEGSIDVVPFRSRTSSGELPLGLQLFSYFSFVDQGGGKKRSPTIHYMSFPPVLPSSLVRDFTSSLLVYPDKRYTTDDSLFPCASPSDSLPPFGVSNLLAFPMCR